MKNWYVVHTQPRAETRATWHLRNQNFEVYLPVFRKQRRHARKRDWVRAPLFPRYLFLRMNPGKTAWRSIASTVGVIDIVRVGNAPTPVPAGIVEQILSREGDDGCIRNSELKTFREGDVVRICDGALADCLGAIDRLNDAERVTLLLDILGRPVKVRMPIDSIAAVS